MRRFGLVLVAVLFAFTTSGAAEAAHQAPARAGDDLQLYNGMASGAIAFASNPASMVVLTAPPAGDVWEIRNVVLGSDAVATDLPALARWACWFSDGDGEHPFASFRIATTPAGSAPRDPPIQQPVWFDALKAGQVVCGGDVNGATILGGIAWFRFAYRATPDR